MFSAFTSSKDKELNFTPEDAAAIFAKLRAQLEEAAFSSPAVSADSAISFYPKLSGNGVVTSQFVKKQVESILSGKEPIDFAEKPGRISLTDISNHVDVDKAAVKPYIEKTAHEHGIYQLNDVYFTTYVFPFIFLVIFFNPLTFANIAI